MIPYGRHSIDQSDIDAVTEALKSDYLTTGPLVEKFEKEIKAMESGKEINPQIAIFMESVVNIINQVNKESKEEQQEQQEQQSTN